MIINGVSDVQRSVTDTQIQSTFSESSISVSSPFGGSCVYTAESVLNAMEGETGNYGIRDVSDIVQKDAENTNMLQGEGASNEDALISVEDHLSDKDNKELTAEGDILREYTEEALLRALNRVKIARALNIERIEHTVERQKESDENIDRITENISVDNPKKKMIISKLIDADLPVTEERVKEIASALELWESMSDNRKDAGAYLINNNLQPTIENIYRAKYSGELKKTAISEEIWEKMRPSVETVVKEAGFEPNKMTMDTARELLEQNVPLTPENIIMKQETEKIELLGSDDILDIIIHGEKKGSIPVKTVLTAAFPNIQEAVRYFHKINDHVVETAVSNALRNNISNINLEQLKAAEKQVETDKQEGLGDYPEQAAGISENNHFLIRTRRQLEEIRLKLTADSGYTLAEKGIRPDIASLEEIVEGLRKLEKEYYTELLKETGTPVTDSNLENIQKTSESINVLAESPVYILGSTYSARSIIQINTLVSEGASLSVRFNEAGESYEALMTRPRYDMGDSIKKAFLNSDSLLKELNMEINESNRRAVRILGYNNMEISRESINGMKAYDSHVNSMLYALKPHIVSKMIKDGYNPLEHTVSEVIKKCESLADNESRNEERYSAYLVKLERSKAVTETERAEYISIYRALYQIEQSDGAAVGAVVNNGESITVRNLIKAVRSSHARGMDKQIDSEFGLYYGEVAEDILKELSPEKLINIAKETSSEPSFLTPEKLKEYLFDMEDSVDDELYNREQAGIIRDAAASLKTEGEILRELGLSDSINMKSAMQELITENNFYKKLYRITDDLNEDVTTDTIVRQDTHELPEMESTLQEFDSEYARILEASTHLLEAAFEREELSGTDIALLRTLNQGIRLRSGLQRKRYYEIPVEVNGEIGCINLTLKSDSEDTGRIDIRIPFEEGELKIAARMEGGKLEYRISTDESEIQDISGIKETLDTAFKERGTDLLTEENTSGIDIWENKGQYMSEFANGYLNTERTIEAERIRTGRLYEIAKVFITTIYSYRTGM